MVVEKLWNLQLRSHGNFLRKNRNIWSITSIIVTIVLSPSFIDILPENNPDMINSESDPASFTDSITATHEFANSESGTDIWTFVETVNVVKSGSDQASVTDSIRLTITKSLDN